METDKNLLKLIRGITLVLAASAIGFFVSGIVFRNYIFKGAAMFLMGFTLILTFVYIIKGNKTNNKIAGVYKFLLVVGVISSFAAGVIQLITAR